MADIISRQLWRWEWRPLVPGRRELGSLFVQVKRELNKGKGRGFWAESLISLWEAQPWCPSSLPVGKSIEAFGKEKKGLEILQKHMEEKLFYVNEGWKAFCDQRFY